MNSSRGIGFHYLKEGDCLNINQLDDSLIVVEVGMKDLTPIFGFSGSGFGHFLGVFRIRNRPFLAVFV